MSRGNLIGKYPAIIKSYDPDSRTCLVFIPSITEGDGDLRAEIEYPIGDRSRNTEIRILKNDHVWCEFIQGDPRYPIITGFRNPLVGNSNGVRHWEHDNIEIVADSKITLTVGGTSLTLTAQEIMGIAGKIGLQGSLVASGGATLSGGLGVNGGAKIDGIEFGQHYHDGKHGQTSPPKK